MGVAAVVAAATAAAITAGAARAAPITPAAPSARAVPGVPVAPSRHAGLSWPLVIRGAMGPRVVDIQYLLNERIGAGLKADGIFGPQTERAVRRFQAKYGLTVDGKVGNQTWSRLIITVQYGSNGPSVLAVQYSLGFVLSDPVVAAASPSPPPGANPPAPTGNFDVATRAAVESFQARWHLAVDGIVGPVTWNALVVHEP